MKPSIPSRVLSAAIISTLLMSSAQAEQRTFDLDEQDATKSIPEFARQAGIQISAPTDQLKGIRTPRIKGELDVKEALQMLIEDTGLIIASDDGGMIVLQKANPASNQTSETNSSEESSAPEEPVARVENELALEEIFVTARKRTESILRVPVVATALTADQLSHYGARDLHTISNQVPGLQISTVAGNNGAQVALRGIGTNAINPAVDQSVSLNIDGMQMTQGNAYKVGMFDLAQVEVLKGPQSLFYGKNSPGGVIAMRSADPTDEFELRGRVGYEFEAEQKRGELIVSGPVSDTLRLRLAAAFTDTEGYFRNEAVGQPAFGGVTPRSNGYGQEEEWILRGTALWNPTDRFSARFKANFASSRREGDSGVGQFISCPDGVASPTGIPFLEGEDCKPDKVVRQVDLLPSAFVGIRNDGVPFADYDQWFGSLEMNYELTHELTLTSVTGYYDLEQSVLLNVGPSTAAGPALASQGSYDRDDFTQEIRLTSDFVDSPVNFMVGAFYQDGFMRNALDSPINQLVRPQGPARLSLAHHDIDVRSISAFGQVLWKVIPELELTAGARWTDEEREHKQINLISGSPVRTPLAVPKIKSDNVSPEFTATYMPTDNLTFFGAYREGFKSGSFNTSGTQPAGSDTSFGDERVEGGELGMKARLFARSLSLNLAGYRYKYRDMQVGVNYHTPTGGIGTRTLNAASATIYGVDADFVFRPYALPDLTVRGGLNWNHARFDRFDNSPCWGGQLISQGCDRLLNPSTGQFTAQDLSGKRMTRAPEWSGALGFDYQMHVGQDMLLVLSSSALYSSKYYTNLFARADMVQSGYVKTSASIALRAEDDAWEVALIGNNLGDKLICNASVNGNFQNGILFGGQLTGTETLGVAGVDELTCPLNPGREVWLRFTMSPRAFLSRF